VLIISRKLYSDRLIKEKDIIGNIVLIDGSDTDYITEFGDVYKKYNVEENLYFKKNPYINKHNGYVYVGITFSDGVNRNRRLHILIAKAHIKNPNPSKYNIVGHLDNDKSNYNISNLYWTNTSENTKKAFDEGLAINASGYEDSQSIPVYCLTLDKNIYKEYGSMILAHKELGVSVSTISRQCKHDIKTNPRCGYYFRFQEEYDNQGFVK
jgi:hypothetical protein